MYHTVKIFDSKKVWRIGTQNRFGREKFSGLSIYTEGNQSKTDELADKT